jgi:hypothetical protein
MTAPGPLGMVGIDAPVEKPSTALESLRADFTTETADDIKTLPAAGRPGYEVRFTTRIDYEDYAAWMKEAQDPDMPNGLNELRLGCIVLANCCRGIIRNGEEIVTDGKPMTFVSPALHSLLGVERAVDAARRFYDRDPNTTKTASAVLAAAGYDGKGLSTDPTPL